jgi:hypothetical protein
MTTTVTLKTHDWPVDVTTTDNYEAGRHLTTKVETVEPHTERQFHITDSRSIMFAELPLPPRADTDTE